MSGRYPSAGGPRYGRLAEDVKVALTKKIGSLPELLRLSLTWDRGKEMGEHASFTVETGVQVYFAHRLLQIRARALNHQLRDDFERWHPALRPSPGDARLAA